MKIAVMGSASSSVMKAPFADSRYDEWVQGRIRSAAIGHAAVPGDWDIWGCSPGAWAVIPRATRWFEVHRWEPEKEWFSPQYCEFLRTFKGPVYTGGPIPEFPTSVVYPIDRMEEKFSSYFMTSSLALMLALAIDTIDEIRIARNGRPQDLPPGINPAELDASDEDDMIGMWGVDMAATEEYAYQRPGCQFFMLEALRRGIGVYLPPESDLMRPMPVYGISEWDHNYIKLTSRARELNAKMQEAQAKLSEGQQALTGIQGEMHALNMFVQTWTSPYGMEHGIVNRQVPGTGLGGGITHVDARPVAVRIPAAQDAAFVPVEIAPTPTAKKGRAKTRR
jgi:hypothetical protein